MRPRHWERNDAPVWIGQSSYTPGRNFKGGSTKWRFSLALSATEVEAMFNVGNPAPGRQR